MLKLLILLLSPAETKKIYRGKREKNFERASWVELLLLPLPERKKIYRGKKRKLRTSFVGGTCFRCVHCYFFWYSQVPTQRKEGMESDSAMVAFPLLTTPIESNYRACTIPYRFPSDNPRKATPTEIAWIDLFRNSIPSFKYPPFSFSFEFLFYFFPRNNG